MKNFAALKTIPGFNEILKVVLKAQIEALVEQLHDQTGEESLLLTASVSDGALGYLGSKKGQGFLDGRQDIKSQFLKYCLNGPISDNQVPDTCILQKTTVAGESNAEGRGKRNKPQKHKPNLNDVNQHTTTKKSRSSQQLPSIQQRTIEHIPISTALSTQLGIQQNKGQFVQNNGQQLPVLRQTTDQTGLYFQNLGQHFTLSLLPGANNVSVSPNANNVSVLPNWTNILTTLSGNRAPALQSGGHVSVPVSENTFLTPLDGSHESLSRNVNNVSVSSSRNHLSASGDRVNSSGNNVSVVANHEPVGGTCALSTGNISAGMGHVSGRGHHEPSSLNGNHSVQPNLENMSCVENRKHGSVPTSGNQISLSPRNDHVLLTPSGNSLTVPPIVNHDTQITTNDNLIKQCVVDPITSMPESLTSKCADKQNEVPIVSMETLLVNTVNSQNNVLVSSDILSSGFADTDKIESKDKTKKTLSSKIEEITERIKKDDPQKSQEDELMTADVPQVLVPEVKPKGATNKSDNQKTRQRKSGKSKDTSRASHRKPKLPRYNIGAASDEEEVAEEEDLSSIDILDIAAGIEDSNSSFAHINLDEFGDGMMLKESEADIPLAGLFTCNNEDETNKAVIQNVFNLKPTEHAIPGHTGDGISNKINYVGKGTDITKSDVEIRTATDNRTKKSGKEVSLINKKLWLKCSLCPVRFPNQDMLKQHMQTVVHRKKKYVCDLCGWKFGQLRDKERHRRTHTGERPFKCDVCNKAFARKDNLKLHERKHKLRVS